MKYTLATIVLIFSTRLIAADCDQIDFTSPSDVLLDEGNFLIVVHPASIWDPRASAKLGIDFVMNEFKKSGRPTIVLRHQENNGFYYNQNCSPQFYVESQSGELPFTFEARKLTLAGGQFHQCFRKTFRDVLSNFQSTAREATIKINAESVYTTFSYIDSSKIRDVSEYLRIVGNAPKLTPVYITLAQLMRIVGKDESFLIVKRFLEDENTMSTLPESFSNQFQFSVKIDNNTPKLVFPGANKPTIHMDIATKFPWMLP